MSQTPAPPTPAPPRRSRWQRLWRFCTQFSLRTLLVVTTLAALGCWWYLQPETRDELLAGKHLKLRRQVRLLPEDATRAPSAEPRVVSSGRWRLRDANDDLLVSGRFDNDQPHGLWTIYHVNGRKAVEGLAFHGARSGVWRTWSESGQLTSEVTYRAVGLPLPIGPAGYWGSGFGMGGSFFAKPIESPRYASQRHGPAKAWHANGRLQFDGGYEEDRREGAWRVLDEAGRVTAAGSYRRGQREGPWTILDAATGEVQTVRYFAGLKQDEYEAILANCRRQLQSPHPRRHAAAIERLASFREHGQPSLAAVLDDERLELRRQAAEALASQTELLPAIVDQLDRLTADRDYAIRRFASVAVYRERASRRNELFEPLVASLLADCDETTRRWALDTLYAADEVRREELLLAAAALPVQVSRLDPFAELGPDYANWVASWQPRPDAHLAAAFQSPDPTVRRFVLLVIHRLAIRGGGAVEIPGSQTGAYQYKIPVELQPLVERARLDPDKDVARTAGLVGQFPGELDGR